MQYVPTVTMCRNEKKSAQEGGVDVSEHQNYKKRNAKQAIESANYEASKTQEK
jgi:hypothetical protein